MTQERPYVWEMIKEAVEHLGGHATYGQIMDHINQKWPGVNKNTITAQIVVCTVNHPSRIHYPENSKPRLANARYDFLYKVGRGEVVLYDPQKHGQWAIVERDGKRMVMQEGVLEPEEEQQEPTELEPHEFALEAHLRDSLAKHLEVVEKGLTLFKDASGREGIEYPTETGPIDILTRDKDGNLVVFELKVSRGPDRAVGQLMRYMGWVRKHLANSQDVRGIVVARAMDEGLKYAASENQRIKLLQYELSFKLTSVEV